MPTYSYICKSCGSAIEVQQSFADAALTNCESCGGELRKQFGNLGVSFKGSGFYRTDSSGKQSESKSDTGSTSGSSSS